MKSLVVDTNVVSYLLRGGPLCDLYVADLHGNRLCVSFVTVAELRFGALNKKWGERRMRDLAQALRGYVVLGFDDDTAWRWAEIAAHERSAGRNRDYHGDWWIAACALRHGLPLVTHNPRDFAGIPRLQVITHAPDSSS
jgi:predicted nucleic acid-binding protein